MGSLQTWVKRRSCWRRVSPNSNMPGVLRRRQHVKIRHAQRGDDAKGEDGYVTMEAEITVICPWAKDWWHHQKLRAWNRFSPGAFRESMALPTPGFWTTNLRTGRHCCYIAGILDHSSRGTSVTAATGNKYTMRAYVLWLNGEKVYSSKNISNVPREMS